MPSRLSLPRVKKLFDRGLKLRKSILVGTKKVNRSALKAFLADQRIAKEIVSTKLGISGDIRALEWSLRYCEIYEAYNAALFAEIFKPHGYGLELSLGPT